MLKYVLKAAAPILAAVLLLSSCSEGKRPSFDYQIDMKQYENAIAVNDKRYLVLVNKQNPCGEAYVPEELVTVPAGLTLYGKEIMLEQNAALAAEALVKELHARGYEDIVITSGYRDYAYQQVLFNTYLGNEMKAHPDWTVEQCRVQVLSYSALPGESEHQTGLCVDLISTNHVVLDESFADHVAYSWLVKNAHAFGFILRYPKGEEGTTGYSYEPWHYRFVGIEAASAMYEKGLTLEEYVK